MSLRNFTPQNEGAMAEKTVPRHSDVKERRDCESVWREGHQFRVVVTLPLLFPSP